MRGLAEREPGLLELGIEPRRLFEEGHRLGRAIRLTSRKPRSSCGFAKSAHSDHGAQSLLRLLGGRA